MAKNIKHHYLSEFYLNGFVDPDHKPYLWIYEKDKKEIRCASANDIGAEKHYFSFWDPDGIRDSKSIERIRNKIEGRVAACIKKMAEGKAIDEEDKAYFATFLAFTFSSVPSFRKNICNFIPEITTVQISQKSKTTVT